MTPAPSSCQADLVNELVKRPPPALFSGGVRHRKASIAKAGPSLPGVPDRLPSPRKGAGAVKSGLLRNKFHKGVKKVAAMSFWNGKSKLPTLSLEDLGDAHADRIAHVTRVRAPVCRVTSGVFGFKFALGYRDVS